MMRVREYVKESRDYDFIVKTAHYHSDIPPIECILPNGAVIEDEDTSEIYAVGFVYISMYTDVAVIEWIHLNQSIKPRLKREALNLLIGALETIADVEDRKFIMTASKYNGMTKQFLRNGYMIANNGFSHLVKIPEV